MNLNKLRSDSHTHKELKTDVRKVKIKYYDDYEKVFLLIKKLIDTIKHCNVSHIDNDHFNMITRHNQHV